MNGTQVGVWMRSSGDLLVQQDIRGADNDLLRIVNYEASQMSVVTKDAILTGYLFLDDVNIA